MKFIHYKMLRDKWILMVRKEVCRDISHLDCHLDLLWMSPEHVRTSIIKNDVATVMTSSAAGDVYSFGIIMQEVILRGPPFCMLDLTPQGECVIRTNERTRDADVLL